jgi:multiple sugar transport system permease protein
LYRAYREIPLPLWMSDSGQLLDSYWGLILVNVAVQTGSGTFVLGDYMKTLPHEMDEAPRVAGSIVIALPVLIVFFVLHKQFVAGLTLGSTKG